jgi:hypothetical protein
LTKVPLNIIIDLSNEKEGFKMIIDMVAFIAVVSFEIILIQIATHPKEKEKTSIKWELKHGYADYLD